MPIYAYKGMNAAGKEIKGSINTEGIQQAKAKIKAQGLMLLEIKEQKSQTKQTAKSITFGKSVNISDLAMMTRQLATLLRAKIQIVDAFSALIDQTENPKLRIILSEIRQKVNEGTSLAKSFADYPEVFDNVYVNMVDAGEASGNLEVVLLRLADFTEGEVKLRNRVKGAMTYPIIMMTFGGIMMGVIFVFVIPKITKIFISMKKELPIQTQISIWISNFLQSYWWAVIIGVFVGRFMFKRWSTGKGEYTWHALILKLPVFGPLLKMVDIGRFCSTLATLLNSGVPIMAAMRIVTNLISNVHIKDAISESRSVVSEGGSMVGPLKKSGHFPPMVTHMISLGEKTGELEDMLTIISENYEDQVDTRLNGLTSVLEPVMMVGMGLAVAFIVFSVVVPMMELNSVK